MGPKQVRCADIHPDPRSRGYLPQEVEPLAESVREHGVLRPLLLRVTAGGYVIVHGERRWRAAQMAGLPAIPAWLVQEFEPRDAVAA
jgi:ParB family chromosome partitioning protein